MPGQGLQPLRPQWQQLLLLLLPVERPGAPWRWQSLARSLAVGVRQEQHPWRVMALHPCQPHACLHPMQRAAHLPSPVGALQVPGRPEPNNAASPFFLARCRPPATCSVLTPPHPSPPASPRTCPAALRPPEAAMSAYAAEYITVCVGRGRGAREHARTHTFACPVPHPPPLPGSRAFSSSQACLPSVCRTLACCRCLPRRPGPGACPSRSSCLWRWACSGATRTRARRCLPPRPAPPPTWPSTSRSSRVSADGYACACPCLHANHACMRMTHVTHASPTPVPRPHTMLMGRLQPPITHAAATSQESRPAP